MQGVHLRKYGVQTTINFDLFEVDGVDFRVNAVHAAGDSKIMKDEGAEANTTNGFTDEGNGYSIVLTATEMQAARIVIYLVDQTATKVWLDKSIIIETYGNASAQHAFDLGTATQSVDVTKISGDSTAAVNLEADYDGTGYNKPASTIGTTTTNTDMRGTDSAALATVCTEARLAELDAANIPSDVDAIPAAVWAEALDGAYTAKQILQILAAVLAGKSDITETSAGVATVDFRDLADTLNRVSATMNQSERTAVTIT